MDRPTAASVRALAESGDPAKPRVSFPALGYPVPEPPAQDTALASRVALAVGIIEQITGREPLESVPDDLAPIAEEATLLMTVQRIVTGSGKALTQSVGGGLDGIKSLRAGDYQVTRRDLTEVAKAGLINPSAELSELLLLLCTPERAEELRAELSGQPAPAMFSVGRSPGPGYGYGWDGAFGLGALYDC